MSSPLDRYAASLRRPRIVYAVVLAVVVAVFGTVFAVVVATGSAAHATLHTVSASPADLPLGTASARQTRAWSSSDRLADGTPQWQGTVVTWSAHTVRGRDARTGAQTWSYTRSDRTVCAAAQLNGTTVAVFDRSGNCDEADALDSATGQRRWARTLDQDGQPVDGRPAFQWSSFGTFLVTTPAVVYAIDPVSGLNRWTYARYGCHIDHAVLGTAGVLISQDCDARTQCAGVEDCVRGHQLFLRDASAPKLATTEDNYDRILWSRTDTDAVPASADLVVSALQAGRLDVLSPSTGATTARLPVAAGSTATSSTTTAGTLQLLWTGGHAYAVATKGDAVSWSVAATGPPTVAGDDGGLAPSTADARLTVPTSTGVATVDATDGSVRSRYAVAVPPAGSRAFPLGTGFVVGSSSGTVVYR